MHGWDADNVQELVYGSANQQFVCDQENQTIVGLMCPEYVIEVPEGNCSSTAKLHLSNKVDTSNDGRNQWIFEKENRIRSVKCADMFIILNGASGGGARTVVVPTNQLAPSATVSSNSGTRLSGQGEVSLQVKIKYVSDFSSHFHLAHVIDICQRFFPARFSNCHSSSA